MKSCPYCHEFDLQDGATVCKHCHRNIAEAEKPFYLKNIGYKLLIVLCVFAGFLFPPLWILAIVFLLLEILSNRK